MAQKKKDNTRAKQPKPKPGLVKTITFGKKKVKVGKILKKANTTDTRVKTKQLVLLEQLKATSAPVVSHRGLSLDDLCRRLGHYNENVCRDAIIEVKEMFVGRPDLIVKNLRTIIPSIGRLISAGVKENTTRSQLKVLLKIIFNVPGDAFSSHFSLLCTHLLAALTDFLYSTKMFAFEALLLLLKHFPKLCAKKCEIFDQYLQLMCSDRRPTNRSLVDESIALITSVYGKSTQTSLWNSQTEIKLSVDKRTCTPSIEPILPLPAAITFPVLYSSQIVEQNDNAERLKKLETVMERLRRERTSAEQFVSPLPSAAKRKSKRNKKK